MLEFDEKNILAEFNKAFKGHLKNKIVDLDERVGKKLDSFIMRLEKVAQDTALEIPPHQQSRFTIIYITKGKGEKVIGASTVPVKNNTVLIIPSNVASSSVYKRGLKGYCLSINFGCFFQKSFPWELVLKMQLFDPGITPYFYPDTKTGKLIEQIFETILFEVHNTKKNKEFLIAGKILELLILCDRMLKAEKRHLANHQSPLVVRFISLIQEHYKKHHSVSFYAEKLHVHPNWLNATVRKSLRQSAKATIDLKLISESKYLLHLTNLSVKQIAYELGFESASNFFRFFKRHTGNSPLEYRNNI